MGNSSNPSQPQVSVEQLARQRQRNLSDARSALDQRLQNNRNIQAAHQYEESEQLRRDLQAIEFAELD
jgi:hypothetical protein